MSFSPSLSSLFFFFFKSTAPDVYLCPIWEKELIQSVRRKVGPLEHVSSVNSLHLWPFWTHSSSNLKILIQFLTHEQAEWPPRVTGLAGIANFCIGLHLLRLTVITVFTYSWAFSSRRSLPRCFLRADSLCAAVFSHRHSPCCFQGKMLSTPDVYFYLIRRLLQILAHWYAKSQEATP